MKTTPPHPVSFSTGNPPQLRLTAPTQWQGLPDEWLRYILFLMGNFQHSTAVKTLVVIRYNALERPEKAQGGFWYSVSTTTPGQRGTTRRRVFIADWQMHEATRALSFIDSVRGYQPLHTTAGLTAVNSRLHGVRFADYLQCEKYWSAIATAKETAPDPEKTTALFAAKLAQTLYLRRGRKAAKPPTLTKAEQLNVLLWYAAVRETFQEEFKHLFAPAGENTAAPPFKETMNAQIRALTDGDPTKEQAVFDLDTWRALTELNEKAREAAEIRKITSK